MLGTLLLKWFDKYILGLICIILSVFKKNVKIPKNPKNIAVIRIWNMGDAVNSLPMLKLLKEKTGAKITVISEYYNKDIFNQEFVDELLFVNNKPLKLLKYFKKFDLVLDTEHHLNQSTILSRYIGKYCIGYSNQIRSRAYHKNVDFRKDTHIVLTYIKFAQASGITIKPNEMPKTLIPLKYSKDSENSIKKILLDNKIKSNDKLVAIFASVGRSVKEREWPKEKFRELCKKLTENPRSNIKILLIGTKSDYELNKFIKEKNSENNEDKIKSDNKIIILPSLSLGELFCIAKRFDCAISNDTGPMHIFAAQNTPTIGLFGPNTPKIWGPFGPRNVSLFKPKRGCPFLDNTRHELVPYNLTFEQKTCMDAISVNDVYLAVKKIIAK